MANDNFTSGIIAVPDGKLPYAAIRGSTALRKSTGNGAPNAHRISTPGQKRGIFGVIKRKLRRYFDIEPAIGRKKDKATAAAAISRAAPATLPTQFSTVGRNFQRALAWFKVLLPPYTLTICRTFA